MKRTILMAITLLALLPDVAKGQWTFDIVSVEAYINDHKKTTQPVAGPKHAGIQQPTAARVQP